MENKKYSIIRKIITCTITFCLIISMQGIVLAVIHDNPFIGECTQDSSGNILVNIKSGDFMFNLINQLNDSRLEGEELAKKIIELCSDLDENGKDKNPEVTLQKVEALKANYFVDGVPIWLGGDQPGVDSAVTEAQHLAESALKNNTEVDGLTEEQKNNLLDEISDLIDEISKLKDGTEEKKEKAKALDSKLNEYIKKTGDSDDQIIRQAILVVNDILKEEGEEGSEALEEMENQDKERQEFENSVTEYGGASTGTMGDYNADANHTVDDIIQNAQNFINKADSEKVTFSTTNLGFASDTLYNILLAVGIAGSVIVGMYLGVKFMLASAEDKAKVKESLIPYIAGCVVIFGAFTIWKLAVLLLNQLG